MNRLLETRQRRIEMQDTQLKEMKESLDKLVRKLPSHGIALFENTKCFTCQKEGDIALDCLENQG